jgi:hypothetical protein
MHITSSQTQLVILPPARSAAPRVFRNIEIDSRRYDRMLAEMQRLRGRVYLRDGAIQADELTPDGRHKLAIDERSWHILLLDDGSRVSGCLRYLEERKSSRFDELWIYQSALSHSPVWGKKFRRAVEMEMARAWQKRIGFGVVGGWAIAEERRRTIDPLRMVLTTCGLFRLLGGCAGLATATVRHGSASILRRIGLTPLTVDGLELPPYYDPRYRCQMEALRFDSDFPSPKYAAAIEETSSRMELGPVICREDYVPEWCGPLPVTGLPAAIPRAISSLQPAISPAG